jgi:putative hydrolase of the HAD superfamily
MLDHVRIDTLLFDFGGTLDASGVHWLTRFYALYPQVGLQVEPECIKEAFYCADAALPTYPEVSTWRFLPMMQAHVTAQLRHLGLPVETYLQPLAEGFWHAAAASLQTSVRVLRALRRRYTLGIISNFYGNVTTLCQECGLADLCDVIIDSAAVGVRKPDPQIFTLALRHLGRVPYTAAYVGDSFERDVLPARSAGLQTIWLRGQAPRPCPDPSAVDATLSSLEELPALLHGVPASQGQTRQCR